MRPEEPGLDHIWTARRLEPVVAFYVAGVFGAFMALAYFVFHSTEAVKALILAGVGALVSMVPSILTRVEYKVTETGLAMRVVREKKPGEFKDVFSWPELDYVVPTRRGFRFYKRIRTSRSLVRFLKVHFSGGYSGEVHADSGNRIRVESILEDHSIPTSRTLPK